jgi:hypothetical protein
LFGQRIAAAVKLVKVILEVGKEVTAAAFLSFQSDFFLGCPLCRMLLKGTAADSVKRLELAAVRSPAPHPVSSKWRQRPFLERKKSVQFLFFEDVFGFWPHSATPNIRASGFRVQ